MNQPQTDNDKESTTTVNPSLSLFVEFSLKKYCLKETKTTSKWLWEKPKQTYNDQRGNKHKPIETDEKSIAIQHTPMIILTVRMTQG